MGHRFVIEDTNFGTIKLTEDSFRRVSNLSHTDSNVALFLVSMMEHDSNSSEYRLASRAMYNHLRENLSDSKERLICPHSDWYGLYDETVVDETVCRFCGIKGKCDLYQKGREIEIRVEKIDSSYKLPKELLTKKCFQKDYTNKKSSFFDPFTGFSLESKLSRTVYCIPVDYYNKLFDLSGDIDYHPTALQHCVGMELTNGKILWPLDIEFLRQRFENKDRFLRELRSSSSYSNYKLNKIETDFILNVSVEYGWIKNDNELLIEAMLELFADLVNMLQKIEYIRILAKSSISPMVDIPTKFTSSGMIDIALRWAMVLPGDLDLYLNHCPRNEYFELKKLLINQIKNTPPASNDVLNLELKKPKFTPRFPLILLINSEHTDYVSLNVTNGKIIHVIICDVEKPYYVMDPLGVNMERILNVD